MSRPGPQARALADGRLHLQHGPIDLVIEGRGAAGDVRRAYAAARERFATILGELVGELPLLRRPLAGDVPPDAESAVARRMIAACWPHRAVYITPMAAVAGSVADEIKAAMLAAAPGLAALTVNNGGDIALHAAPGETLRIGLVGDLARAAPQGVATIRDGVGGVATSGWRGRSFSLGVADAATVLAASAAAADAAATLVANAVDADDPAIRRAAGRSLDPDTDLGDILVTVDVPPLPEAVAEAALAAGLREADRLVRRGFIRAAAITLQGRWRIAGAEAGLFPPMA